MSRAILPLIVAKRDGHRHSREDIHALVDAITSGEAADYQVSAWLMAAYLKGLDDDETVALTETMLHSGLVSKGKGSRPRIDKHSTGGVGDKISLCLAPAAAACGLSVPMISGRGLGHTGGTVDKLEAIPGYRTRLGLDEFERIVERVGTSMIAPTPEIAPADARLYALRDVTGTVDSIPLIVASILSKKLAEGIDGLVLDVKVGRGAFMKDAPAARRLADALISVTTRAGKRASATLTDMNAPIGRFIGNALETREAIDVLRGHGPPDTVELTVELGADMLCLGGIGTSHTDRCGRLQRALSDGSALDVFRRMVEAHGGDPRVADDDGVLPVAPHRVPVLASVGGVVQAMDALTLGQLGVTMGAGRLRSEDAIDPAVGIELEAAVGVRVNAGDPLAWLHVQTAKVADEWLETVKSAFTLGEGVPETKSRVLERRGVQS